MPAYTLEAWRNLWLHTGDLGKLDADGYLYFLGRKKDVIRHRGENILPFEVEGAVNTYPALKECVVLGVPGSLGDQEVAAIVLRHDGESIREEDLRAHCENKMARWMIPTIWNVVDEVPRTPTGKPVKATLLALLGY